jgi:hypothetical protein
MDMGVDLRVLAPAGWAALTTALPLALISISVFVVVVAALPARRPSTRRYCLDLLSQLTRYAAAVRGTRQ